MLTNEPLRKEYPGGYRAHAGESGHSLNLGDTDSDEKHEDHNSLPKGEGDPVVVLPPLPSSRCSPFIDILLTGAMQINA